MLQTLNIHTTSSPTFPTSLSIVSKGNPVPNTILEVTQLTRQYQVGGRHLTVLHDASFTINEGESVAIIGPSGSGKSTLLGLCAGLDQPTSGNVRLVNQDIARMNEDERAVLRRDKLGFVFQAFQLLPTLTALENVMVPMEMRGKQNTHKLAERATELLNQVGLGERLDHYPVQLSGGEQQRVAIARAFMNDPALLFADEPTGNLDTATGKTIVSLLFDLNEHHGTTLVLVTHDDELASKATRIIRLQAGKIITETNASSSSY